MKKRVNFSSGFEDSMCLVKAVWYRENEVGHHGSSTIRKQGMLNVNTQVIFPYNVAQDSSRWNGVFTFKMALSSSKNSPQASPEDYSLYISRSCQVEHQY